MSPERLQELVDHTLRIRRQTVVYYGLYIASVLAFLVLTPLATVAVGISLITQGAPGSQPAWGTVEPVLYAFLGLQMLFFTCLIVARQVWVQRRAAPLRKELPPHLNLSWYVPIYMVLLGGLIGAPAGWARVAVCALFTGISSGLAVWAWRRLDVPRSRFPWMRLVVLLWLGVALLNFDLGRHDLLRNVGPLAVPALLNLGVYGYTTRLVSSGSHQRVASFLHGHLGQLVGGQNRIRALLAIGAREEADAVCVGVLRQPVNAWWAGAAAVRARLAREAGEVDIAQRWAEHAVWVEPTNPQGWVELSDGLAARNHPLTREVSEHALHLTLRSRKRPEGAVERLEGRV